MVNPAEIHGKRLAMLTWGKSSEGKDHVLAFTGIADWDGKHLKILRQPGQPFPVLDEWFERLRPVPLHLKLELFGAEYYFSVTIGPLPDGADVSQYLATGLKWPLDDDAH